MLVKLDHVRRCIFFWNHHLGPRYSFQGVARIPNETAVAFFNFCQDDVSINGVVEATSRRSTWGGFQIPCEAQGDLVGTPSQKKHSFQPLAEGSSEHKGGYNSICKRSYKASSSFSAIYRVF